MEGPANRIQVLQRHLQSCQLTPEQYHVNKDDSANSNSSSKNKVSNYESENIKASKTNHSSIPRRRQELLKWNGWGYKDSKFDVHFGEKIHITFTGNRYKIGNNTVLPHFLLWVMETLGVDPLVQTTRPQDLPLASEYPNPFIQEEFMESLKLLNLKMSFEGEDRLFRAHGHTLAEILVLREGMFPRLPDLVIWPESHEDVESIVKLATQHQVVIIPYGGGTSVTGALLCPKDEHRMIVSLDTSQMNKILWINTKNMTACIEAGIIGQDLEKELLASGFTSGHEPDSYEFSSLGGWVATRASGMKKNTYGNIEDLAINIKMVTSRGTVEKFPKGPRISAGPDIHHFILGSEGILGVVTEVTIKIRPVPPVKRYGSIVFPDFSSGINFMREVALRRCQPASIRLMDNEQFKFGHSLKPQSGYLSILTDGLKIIYLTKLKGFDVSKMCVVTLLYEGSLPEVNMQEKIINEICPRHGGIPAGETNGERGYMLTFVIAYIRDLGLDYGVVAESFETSVPWDRVDTLCHNVKHRIKTACKARGITHSLASCRVTQTYDAGACVYFYFAFQYFNTGITDPLHVYEEIENLAREEVIGCGGNISHHHGVGKIRKQWMMHTLSPTGIEAITAVKNYLDPDNIFANRNLI